MNWRNDYSKQHLNKVLTAVLRQTVPLSFETSSDCTLCRLQDINTYIFELPERDELDNVSGDRLPHCRPQHAIVSIQQLHGLKVRRPHPNDDDWQRQPRRPNNGVPGLIEVGDLPVSEDEEDVVLLQSDRPESQSECEFLVIIHVCSCVCVLTEAVSACAAVAAMEATWVMRGEKFVGPESLSWGKTCL